MPYLSSEWMPSDVPGKDDSVLDARGESDVDGSVNLPPLRSWPANGRTLVRFFVEEKFDVSLVRPEEGSEEMADGSIRN